MGEMELVSAGPTRGAGVSWTTSGRAGSGVDQTNERGKRTGISRTADWEPGVDSVSAN